MAESQITAGVICASFTGRLGSRTTRPHGCSWPREQSLSCGGRATGHVAGGAAVAAKRATASHTWGTDEDSRHQCAACKPQRRNSPSAEPLGIAGEFLEQDLARFFHERGA